MANCSFCNEEIKIGNGVMFVKADGTVLFFCSGKCRKNMLKLRRIGREVKWTKAYRLFKQQQESKKEKIDEK